MSEVTRRPMRWLLRLGLPLWSRQSSHSAPPDLPVEIWWIILELIEDRATLIACFGTCKALHSMGQEIIKRHRSTRCTNIADIAHIHRELQRNPTALLFLRRARVSSSMLSRLAVELLGKSYRLEYLRIEELTGHVLCLRMQHRLSLSVFASVTSLVLNRVVFSTFMEFARIICGLSQMCFLSLYEVVCKNGKLHDLSKMPFAASLGLKYVGILSRTLDTSSTFVLLRGLFTAPRLSETITEIALETTESLLRNVASSLSQSFSSLVKLKTLYCFVHTDVVDSVSMLAYFLAHLPPDPRLTSLYVDFRFHVYSTSIFDSDNIHKTQEFFASIDQTLSFPQFLRLRRLRIALLGLDSVDYAILTRFKSQILKISRTRRILELLASSRDGERTVILQPRRYMLDCLLN